MSFLTSSSALRLCVWLFDDGDLLLSYFNKRFLLAFRAIYREIQQYSILPHLVMGFIAADRTPYPFFWLHDVPPFENCLSESVVIGKTV